MARSRNIKPGLFTNEVLGEADPIYSLLFVGLWTLADKEGRLEYRPKKIRGQLFPYRFDLDLTLALSWLNDESFITVYGIEGDQYIQIDNWRKHQTPHHKEVESTIPSIEDIKKAKEKQQLRQDQSNVEPTLTQDQANKNASCPTDSLNLIPDTGYRIPDSEDCSNLDFDAFWDLYPRKVGKAKAKTSFERVDEKHYPAIAQDLATRPTHDPQWVKDNGEFIPNPTTYLNQERWGDQWQKAPNAFSDLTNKTINNLREVSF